MTLITFDFKESVNRDEYIRARGLLEEANVPFISVGPTKCDFLSFEDVIVFYGDCIFHGIRGVEEFTQRFKEGKLPPVKNYKADELMRKQFEQALREWGDHCTSSRIQVSSRVSDYIDCDGYKQLKAMGAKILPLIREIYEPQYLTERGIVKNTGIETVRDLGLACLVSELCGQDFEVPANVQGRVEAMKQFTAGWLDSNMQRYS